MDGSKDDSWKPHSLFMSISSICLLIVEILGIVCNSVILAIYYKYSRLRTATNHFILNLALCNLLLATLEIIFSLPSSLSKEWLYGSSGCVAYGFGYHYLMSVAVCSLAVISFDRFCVITKPVRNLRPFVVTKKHARILIAIIHVYSFAFTFPPLVGWNELVPDKQFYTGCYINYADKRSFSMAYILVSTIFSGILPFTLTAYCYTRIYRSVKSSSKRSTLNTTVQKTARREAPRIKSQRKSLTHTRTARMIAVVMFFFFLIWLPFKITGLCQTFGVSVPSLAMYISVFLAKSCVMYNAVVYVFLNHRFRAAFLHLTFICRDDHRRRHTTSFTNHSGRFFEITTNAVDHSYRTLAGKSPSRTNVLPPGCDPDVSSIPGRVTTEIVAVQDTSLYCGAFQDAGRRSVVNEGVVNERAESTIGSCVNEALEVEDGDERTTNKPTCSEPHIQGTENETSDSKYCSDIHSLSHERVSQEVISGALCPVSNIVLSDETTGVEKFVELDVNSLSKIRYV